MTGAAAAPPSSAPRLAELALRVVPQTREKGLGWQAVGCRGSRSGLLSNPLSPPALRAAAVGVAQPCNGATWATAPRGESAGALSEALLS